MRIKCFINHLKLVLKNKYFIFTIKQKDENEGGKTEIHDKKERKGQICISNYISD